MTCTACNRPTSDGIHLCDTCTDNLHSILNDVPELIDDLTDTVAKLDATGALGGTPGFHSTPPAKLPALEIKHTLQRLIDSWTSMLIDYDTRDKPGLIGCTPIVHLRRSINEIRKHDWAGSMLDEMHRVTSRAHRIIDRPKDIRILGRCEKTFEDESGSYFACDGDIKADYDDAIARCEQCASTYLVQDLIEERHRKARGELMTGPEARRWLAEHAHVKITYDDIRNWMKRKLLPYVLARVTTGGRDTKLVYPGDVLQVHLWMHDKHARLTIGN